METKPAHLYRLAHSFYIQYEPQLFVVLVVLAALAFTVGGIFMKLSEGLSKAMPTLVLMALFILGACFQTLAMRREDLGVTYLVVLGLEAVLAFAFGIALFGESTSAGRVAGVSLVAVGIGVLRYS